MIETKHPPIEIVATRVLYAAEAVAVVLGFGLLAVWIVLGVGHG